MTYLLPRVADFVQTSFAHIYNGIDIRFQTPTKVTAIPQSYYNNEYKIDIDFEDGTIRYYRDRYSKDIYNTDMYSGFLKELAERSENDKRKAVEYLTRRFYVTNERQVNNVEDEEQYCKYLNKLYQGLCKKGSHEILYALPLYYSLFKRHIENNGIYNHETMTQLLSEMSDQNERRYVPYEELPQLWEMTLEMLRNYCNEYAQNNVVIITKPESIDPNIRMSLLIETPKTKLEGNESNER
jgi:hypothetical protein